MSKGRPNIGDWSSGSESLFRASRGDHDPSVSDQDRVRDGLARRLAAGSVVTAGANVDAQASAAKSAHGVTVGNLAKLGVVLALVVAGSFIVVRTVGRSTEQLGPMQPAAPAQLPTPFPSRAAVPSGIQAEAAVTPASDARSTVTTLAHTEKRPLIRPAARHLRSRAAPAKRATSWSNPTASAMAQLGSDETVGSHDHVVDPLPPAAQEPMAHAAKRSTPEVTRSDEADDSRAELALVERIHAAMRGGNSSVALALCTKHAQDWPHGTFALEREGLRAIALCDLRSKQAASRARTFLTDHPSTPLAPRVATACAAQLSATDGASND